MSLILMVPLEKWKTVHDLFILKELGNYKRSKSQTIHEIEAELKMTRRSYLAHKTMKNAEQHNHLDDTQCRGRHGRMSIELVVIKVLTLEESIFQRSNMGVTDCDAKSCYDWIILAISVVLETKAGAPTNESTLFARTLQDMRYHMVRTKGISNKTNSHSNENPPWGSGQGACDSPVKWGLTSSTIIKCHNTWAIGRKIQDPISNVLR
eukprot:1654703-Ditylum_brightwellii.AAC.1